MVDLGCAFSARDFLDTTDPHTSFKNAMAEHGLFPEFIIETNGFERFSTKGKPGEKNGYYSFRTHGDIGFGVFGDWSRDLSVSWSSVAEHNMSIADKMHYQKVAAELAKKRDDERAEKYATAKSRANSDLGTFTQATTHPYLERKNVKAQPDFRVNANGELIIPVYSIDGDVVSYQRIDSEKTSGNKKFLFGGQISGCMYFIGGSADITCVCEGISTGLTINEATGYSVVCAFNAGNLKTVATLLRQKYDGTIIICADNDEKPGRDSNPGLKSGNDAASLIGAKCVYPVFNNNEGTDFNDLAAVKGLTSVKSTINAVLDGKPIDVNRSNVVDILSCFNEAPMEREWLIDGLMPCGKVGAIVGAGGTGKSNLAMIMARVIATGFDVAGFQNKTPRRVLVVNVEDDKYDIHRRLYAMNDVYPLREGEMYYLQQNLLIYSGMGHVKPFMRVDGSNPVFTEWAGWLDRSIGNTGAQCVILDTRSRLYGLDENNNDHASQWLSMLESMVNKHGCNFTTIHHVGKGSKGHDQNNARGASAFVDNCRFVLSLSPMDDGTAKYYGLKDEQWKYFSMTASKSNYAEGFAPRWFKKLREGVPCAVDLNELRNENVSSGLLEFFRNLDGYYSKRDIIRCESCADMRDAIKEQLGLTKRSLEAAIDKLIFEGKLTTKEINFEGNKPKKCIGVA